MKRADLEKKQGMKITSKLRQAGTPGRFGAATGGVSVDRREQRQRDQAAGLVPFAIKLDSELVKQLHALAQSRTSPLNEIVAQLLQQALAMEKK